eukprot:NODE_4041_length_378_cov_204.501520_g2939_i1.p2 GENE.NODE_4041_length_378_cov_204.501520_g2939_i1~~NODE_4041_length_378_cov_204.501520_g2939_i1.p2  ORF type:complete len:54 (-),score=15.03 NODE_4041_length_378_cov_204.501520_g2939_i1:5-166(-)
MYIVLLFPNQLHPSPSPRIPPFIYGAAPVWSSLVPLASKNKKKKKKKKKSTLR